MKRTVYYLPATEAALRSIGSQIGIARRDLRWTAADLAGRLGVHPQLIGRMERGAPGTAIGTVFQAAVLCGVPLFSVDPSALREVADGQRNRLALLPSRVRSGPIEVIDDNF